MKRKEKKGVLTKDNFIDYAVFQAVGILRDTSGLDMSPEQLSGYLHKDIRERINLELQELKESPEFKKIPDKRKGQFLYEGIIKYIIEHKPFDERGQKLLEGNLESIVGRESFWSGIFSREGTREKRRAKAIDDYLKSRKTAGEISYAVATNPELYSKEAPELIEAVNELGKYSGRGALAEILYASGNLAKDTYQNIKSATRDSSKKILELARKYVEAPATSSATAVIGILLIFLFNPVRATGSVVSVGNFSNNSILPFIGIGLLFVSGLSFIFRGRKLKKKNF